MSDVNSPEAEAVIPQTPLEDSTGGPVGGGVPDIPKDEPVQSIRDIVEAQLGPEVEEEPELKPEPEVVEAKAEKPKEPEAKEEPKPEPAKERADNGRFKGKDGEEAPARYNPPEKLLPDARDVWKNVPRAVQRDIANMEQSYREEVTRHQEASERYEPIRQYDDLARSNGRDLTYTLGRVVEIENIMQSNPIAALQMLLNESGPRKANGQPLSVQEVAQFIMQQDPRQLQGQIHQAMPKAPDPLQLENQRLQQQMQDMQQAQLKAVVVGPFAAANPRFQELQGPIADLLNSGMIPQTLSPADRLEAAYNMADRLYPASEVDGAQTKGRGPEPSKARVETDSSGQKSIRSSPGAAGTETSEDASLSLRALLEKNMTRMARS